MDALKKITQEDVDALAYRELACLERDFRRMQSDREATSAHVKCTLHSQKKMLQILEKEKQDVLQSIREAQSKPLKRAQIKITKEIKNLLKEYENLTKEIKLKSEQNEELKNKIKKNNQIIHQNQLKSNIEIKKISQKEIQELDSTLAMQTVKYGEVCESNRKLRDETNILLADRIKFNLMYEHLLKELCSGKKVIFDLVEQCNVAYERRRKIEFKLLALRSEAKKNFLQTCTEFMDLNQKVEQNQHLNQFVEIKGRVRNHQEFEREKELEAEQVKKTLEDKLQFYKSIIEQITEEFGQENLDRLVVDFLKIDEDNFNIFSFLNDQNVRLNATVKEVSALHKAIEEQESINAAKREKGAQEMKNLSIEESKLAKELAREKIVIQNLQKDLLIALNGTKVLFNNLLCDWTPFKKMLGQNTEVTIYNLNDFIEAIEKRLQQFCTIIRFRLDKERGRKTAPRATMGLSAFSSSSSIGGGSSGSVLPVTPCPLCIETMDSTDKEALIMPLKLSQIRPILVDEIKRGRWRSMKHPLAECPLPQAQRIIQGTMTS